MPRIGLSGIIGIFSSLMLFAGAASGSGWQILGPCMPLFLYVVLGQLLLPRDPDANAAKDCAFTP